MLVTDNLLENWKQNISNNPSGSSPHVRNLVLDGCFLNTHHDLFGHSPVRVFVRLESFDAMQRNVLTTDGTEQR